MAFAEVSGGGASCGEDVGCSDGKWVEPTAKTTFDEKEVFDCRGLMGGVTAYHFRLLTESQLNGGAGYDYKKIERMTLDQIWHRLCDIKLLEKPVGERTKEFEGRSAVGVLKADDDGYIKGQDADGNPIKAKVGGKSLARRLMEEEQRKKEQEKKQKKRRRRRKRKDGS